MTDIKATIVNAVTKIFNDYGFEVDSYRFVDSEKVEMTDDITGEKFTEDTDPVLLIGLDSSSMEKFNMLSDSTFSKMFEKIDATEAGKNGYFVSVVDSEHIDTIEF